ncbi:hypothetical protein HOE07_04130 [archaeon]|jgi:hypothetical protein|nr:hypothetical protein [archaeon]
MVPEKFSDLFQIGDEILTQPLRTAIDNYFPLGEQPLPENYASDRQPQPVQFQGLGEILFYGPRELHREGEPITREMYENTQRTSIERWRSLASLVPSAYPESILVVMELDSRDSKYRHTICFEAVKIGKFRVKSIL